MIWPLLLAQGAVVAPATRTDWAVMQIAKLLKPRHPSVDPTAFVAQEVAAGRCVHARDADGKYRISVRVAILAGAGGQVRRLVPEAINCPTVEQFSVGLVEKQVRANLAPFTGSDRWFKTTIMFEWPHAR